RQSMIEEFLSDESEHSAAGSSLIVEGGLPCTRRRYPFDDCTPATLDHKALARRHAALVHRDFVEDLKLDLPMLRRHGVAQVAALVAENLDIGLLCDAAPEVVVDVVAVAVGRNGCAHQLDAERRRFFVQEVLLELAGPVVVDVAGERDEVPDP